MILSSLFGSLFADPIDIGAKAPDVKTFDDGGNIVDFGKELSEGTVLVFFYPKAFTGGCTKQVCSIRDGWDDLSARGLKVFGVSSDPAETQAGFKDKYQLPFTLIADTDQKVADAFGKNRFSRHAYIFQDGVLVWRDLSASTANQAVDVIAALDSM
jgi:peroxiredoxin Q/BCP